MLPVVLLPVSRLLDYLLQSEAHLQVLLGDRLPVTLLLVFLPILAAPHQSLVLPLLAVRHLDFPLLDLRRFRERMSTPRSFPLAPLRWSTMRFTSLTDCQSQSLKRS